MKCNVVQLPNDLGTAMSCGRGGPRCWRCRSGSEFQCDFPIGKYKSGKKAGHGRTCNRHLCSVHARHGATKGIDFCEEHFSIAKAAYERRRLKQGNELLYGPAKEVSR